MSNREYEEWEDANTWDPSRSTSLALQDDLAPAGWLEPRLTPGTFDVGMTAPGGYEAYARIFFPFVEPMTGGTLTWDEVAYRNERVPHALMERETIDVGGHGDRYGRTSGSFGPEQITVLLSILTSHTSSTGGWFLLWEGFGDLNPRVFDRDRAMVRHPMRNYHLLRGPITALTEFPDNPDYWWPDDRAWCMCTDTDLEWAYLAGSAAGVEEVLRSPIVDAQATRLENPAVSGMDVINDPDGDVPRSP